MLKGIDVSNWQKAMNFSCYDFVIMKASEGNGYVDKMMKNHLSNIGNKLYGFYHYARPDLGNSPEAEADFFISLIKNHVGKAMLALDWEGNSLNYSTTWALSWLRRVYQKTGVRPLIYISASQEWSGNYNQIAKENFGLWVAHWKVVSPMVKNWKLWAMWQYDGDGLDRDYFNGNRDQFLKYCKSTNNIKPTPAPKPQTMKVGDYVKVLNLKDYNGVINDKWVLNATFKVMEIKGDRVVIGNGKAITGAWKKNDLKRV